MPGKLSAVYATALALSRGLAYVSPEEQERHKALVKCSQRLAEEPIGSAPMICSGDCDMRKGFFSFSSLSLNLSELSS